MLKEKNYVTLKSKKGFYKVAMVLEESASVLVEKVRDWDEKPLAFWVDLDDCELYAYAHDGFISKQELEKEGFILPSKATESLLNCVVTFDSKVWYVVEDCSSKYKAYIINSKGMLTSGVFYFDKSLNPNILSKSLQAYRTRLESLEEDKPLKTPFVNPTKPQVSEVDQKPVYPLKSKKENKIMSSTATVTRHVVNVVLLDPSTGLEDSDSIVKDCGQHVMSKGQQELIQEILMNPKMNIADAIVAHNKCRAVIVDLDILQRTGNEVTLQPIRIGDLQWSIK